MTLNEAKLKIWPSILERAKTKVKAVKILYDNSNVCYYRKDGNPQNTSPENCCFIGYGIKAELYKPSFENHNVTYNDVLDAYCNSLGTNLTNRADSYELQYWLHKIQQVHDQRSNKPEHWDSLLAELAPEGYTPTI